MTAVKVCGLTREEDVALACELGASYVGFNFAAASPRRVTVESAARLSAAAPPGVLRVGVFVSEDEGFLREAVEAAGLDLVQLHRKLRDEDLERPCAPVIAVLRVGREGATLPDPRALERCHAILFDTLDAGRAGGTGVAFDWSLVAGRRWGLPVFLAGGLRPENVAEAVRRVRPAAVDVASGVESGPGVKDPAKMRAFFEAVRGADEEAELREA